MNTVLVVVVDWEDNNTVEVDATLVYYVTEYKWTYIMY